ncbi:OTU domain-containing protein 5-A isoform X2 [Musca domestica]|uniref:ubiquitinyl hydrolase 1 n=1 Tax=Musca domestica TaxID=7370 RepID=A0A1I8N6C8_MUSDO|nr:OTU domain-containing protein 5-A isoform X2 [Musca domestica]
MTIKPVVAAPQKRTGNSAAGGADGDKKDTPNVGDSANSNHPSTNRVSSVHAHRNVVIDNHGQSPQRRVDVYDDLSRHRRSPHKTNRNKRRDHLAEHHHHKRERVADKHNLVPKCNSPHGSGGSGVGGAGTSSSSVSGVNATAVANNAISHSSAAVGNNSPDHLRLGSPNHATNSQTTAVAQAASGLLKAIEDTFSGYNSGDEHLQPAEAKTTADEWQRKDEQFAKCMADRGYILKQVEEDGACLFRAISLQIYGDEEMHDVIRQHTMDYIYKNREYFSHFVTEDINNYIKRKRRKESHGNHIEIQAVSEIYSRPVEVYCYKPTPINIFNSEQLNNGYPPLRLSYQRGSHYNAILDPYNATVGVGLGLAGYKPELQTKEAVRLSEQLEIEQTMFEDKLKTTDWEATNEAIEEQIARESYLQWCRENLQKTRNQTANTASTSATVTSGQAATDCEASPSKYANTQRLNPIMANSTVTTLHGNSSCSSSASTQVGDGTNVNLEHGFSGNSGASPKHLSSKKSDEMGYETDDTDMSSTSSSGGGGGGVGSCSPSSTNARSKKCKSRLSNAKMGKKRRRDTQTNEDSSNNQPLPHKSPKYDSCSGLEKRSVTPDFEHQQPCTSKQSNSPGKQSTASTSALPNTSATTSASSTSARAKNEEHTSSFYQELLEASYASEDFGQLTESEMLQRAIQMSTQDYIEDQKRKYLYGP